MNTLHLVSRSHLLYVFKHIIIVISINLGISFLSAHTLLAQQIIFGKVVRIADGDTLTLLDSLNSQTRIRLHGIDCPENGQDFSNVAKQFLVDHCAGRIVAVEVKDKDRYGRTVGIVYNDQKINMNLELLKVGLAWHYTAYDNTIEFAEAEKIARKHRLGLWVQPNAIAPWKFRQLKKQRTAAQK